MTILLIGGGTGGHITPLLAVAKELKLLKPGIELIGVCERNAKFKHIYEASPDIDQVVQIRAGKYRRYGGLPLKERLTDIKTPLLNLRDAGRTVVGYAEARKLLKKTKPSVILVKGGFVAVPIGLAAARMKIPYITHDSDSIPGLANRIISKWASLHATGMPAELYDYPEAQTIYTGIPVSQDFKKVTAAMRVAAREKLGLARCRSVIAVIGGSQGGQQLNNDVLALAPGLMKTAEDLGIIHISGAAHEEQVRRDYLKQLGPEINQRVVVRGFVSDVYLYTAAADIVVSRASATSLSELAIQALPVVLVPGRLASGHQDRNAAYYANQQAALVVAYGDAVGLQDTLERLLNDKSRQHALAERLHELAKSNAAHELAKVTLSLASR